ncbi:MAG TPA: PRC-barrel domain containing protein [Halococcus sp.]|nr:PRC-barrel domain containing protein [Halococcus sp.]
MSTEITEEHEGVSVFNAEKRRIGIVASVENGTAYVNPDPSIVEEFGAKLGWETGEQETHPLDAEQIATVADDEIILRGDL